MPSISELTPDYLSQALGSLVTSVEMSPVDGGYMADVYRLHVSGAAVPGSLILKLPSTDESRRRDAQRFNSYGKESFFYRKLAGRVSLKTPSCYYNPADHFCLLLEDVGNPAAEDIDPGTCMEELASLHATRLDNQHLPGFEPAFTAADHQMATAGTGMLHGLPQSAAMDILTRYCRDTLRLLPRFLSFEQVLCHMDFRPDNLAINEGRLVVFDWGEFCLAPAGLDIASLLVTACSVEARRRSENQWLTRYARQSGTSAQQVSDSYRLSLLPLFYLPMLLRERGDTTKSEQLLARLLAAISDHADFLDNALKR